MQAHWHPLNALNASPGPKNSILARLTSCPAQYYTSLPARFDMLPCSILHLTSSTL